MTNILFTKLKGQDHEKAVNAKILAFMSKLSENDESPGLNIEKMNNPADPRARTGRVDQALRAVLYRLDVPGEDRTYIYAGTWEHDEAIRRARTQILQRNPINGVTEFIDATAPDVASLAEPVFVSPAPKVTPLSLLASQNYLLTDLTDELGFDDASAKKIFAATTDDELLELADSFDNEWQRNATLALAVGDAISKIRSDLGFDQVEPVKDDLTEDEKLAKSLLHPASRMQFAFIENDEELRRVIEGGDFGQWRVFLHPEQRSYAQRNYNGAFRLTGGAGTGKTVVLLHRTERLAAAEPTSRIILTTYTKALSAMLERDLERLDPSTPRASSLGETGVLVRGVDQLVAAVREMAGRGYWEAATQVFGIDTEPRGSILDKSDYWLNAVDEAGKDLPESLKSATFFDGEYLQVILPNRITSQDEYFRVRRPGRGIALDRRKRAAVWKVVELYRQTARLTGRVSFAESAAIAAAYLESQAPSSVADHVLVDEAQDLTPLHWQLLRALVGEGKNDLFIAEDTHQRIYGQHVVLSRYGIKITGRSRRLTLNYRTTQQNLRYALGVLAGGHYLDSEDSEEIDHGYRSSRTGPTPRPLPAASKMEQYENLARVVKDWLADDSIRPETIAILVRTNNKAADVRNQLLERGVVVAESHTGESGTKPLVLTMHKSKGLEFSRVVLFDVSEGSVPPPWILKGVADEERDDVLLRERSLIYVAASRARDELVVTWEGKPSELLTASEHSTTAVDSLQVVQS
jgi:superfamily I DNA/RNA helicase